MLVLIAIIAGLLAAFFMRSNKPEDYFKSIFVSVAVVAFLLTATYKDYDANQFRNPEFEGVLKVAPWMIGIAEEAIAKIDTLGRKLELIADNFNKLYQQIDELQPLETAAGNIRYFMFLTFIITLLPYNL
ncbi:hypothetical protein N752_26570 [Desulforamulus aquiferis]|nr:hypothetical protein N752_26570 [Desulforamulus aquiferis]